MSNITEVKVTSSDDGTVSRVTAFVNSATIRMIVWIPPLWDMSGRLHVKFTNGENYYEYKNVSCDVMNELMNAESVGKKFNEIVKGKYEYRTF